MDQSVGIGIIGTGFGRRVQVPAFMACENVRIVSVASSNIENARVTAAEAGAGHNTSDWQETVLHRDVDLVCITTPPIFHREMALFAIENGKHILCEKPMAMNVAEAEEMTRASAGKPLLALIDHELRFQPGRRVAHKMLREGEIGEVRHVKCMFQAPYRGDPDIPWNWWADASVGGGALGAIGSHIIDSLNWFLGSEISSVFCQLQTTVKRRRNAGGEMRPVTSDDQSNMLVRIADGELTSDATGLISVSMCEGPGYMNRMDFFGSTGSLRVDHLGDVYVAMSSDPGWRAIDVDLGDPLPGVADTGFARGFMAIAPSLADAIRDGKTHIEHAATFDDGLAVQRVLDAARRSDESGRVIFLPRG